MKIDIKRFNHRGREEISKTPFPRDEISDDIMQLLVMFIAELVKFTLSNVTF